MNIDCPNITNSMSLHNFYDIFALFQFSTHSKIVQMEREIKFSVGIVFVCTIFLMPSTLFSYHIFYELFDLWHEQTTHKMEYAMSSVRHFVNAVPSLVLCAVCRVLCIESEIVSEYPHNNVSLYISLYICISYGSRSFFFFSYVFEVYISIKFLCLMFPTYHRMDDTCESRHCTLSDLYWMMFERRTIRVSFFHLIIRLFVRCSTS